MPPFVLHTLLLVTSTLATYLLASTPALSPYHLQIAGLIVLAYFVGKVIFRLRPRLGLTVDAIAFISLTLLLILSTGTLHSPVFFLLYLLLFAISLIFEPFQSLLLTLTLLTVFFLDTPSANLDSTSIINLATLVTITPLALIFGRKYLEAMEESGKIQILQQIISREEADSRDWVTYRANPTLLSVIETTGDTLMYLSSVGNKVSPARLVEKLRSVHADLILLYQSANNLKEGLNDSEDES